MSFVTLLIALIALIISIISLILVLIIYRELIGKTFVNRNVERSSAQVDAGTNSGQQGFMARASNATNEPISTAFLHAPDLSPEVLAPSLGRPPMPKGGFGTKVVTKREK
jgi:hypothetical protein